MKIVITCGYNHSKNTIALIELLSRENIKIDICLIVTIFNLSRIKNYLIKNDFESLNRKVRDRILGTSESMEIKPINEFFKKNNIGTTKVSSICKANNIRFKFISDLNSSGCISFINNSDLCIYSGGGILRKLFLSSFKIGILNCHNGKLPAIRGINAIEWSTLLNMDYCNSLHFISREIDQGPIIKIIPRNYTECRSLAEARGLSIIYTVLDLLSGLKSILNNEYEIVNQYPNQGKQYFTMHPILKSIVDFKFSINT